MNDRFKFRVWDVQHQKYLDFDLLDKESLNDFSYFAIDEAPDYNEQISSSGNTCWALIIEQCTSLKDKNGNLIYEGDIVTNGEDNGFIYWSEKCGAWSVTGFLFRYFPNDLEIIGNIHEN